MARHDVAIDGIMRILIAVMVELSNHWGGVAVQAAPSTLIEISNSHIGTMADIDKTMADYAERAWSWR